MAAAQRFTWLFILLLGAVAISGCFGTGVDRGVIVGTVTGSPPIAGVEILAASATRTITAVTGADGSYRLTAPVGMYTVTASKYGYVTQTEENVEVAKNTDTVVDFQQFAIDPDVPIDPLVLPAQKPFNLDLPADLSFTIQWNAASEVTGMNDGTADLVEGPDYAVVNNELNIFQSYLETVIENHGEAITVTVEFDVGAPVELQITGYSLLGQAQALVDAARLLAEELAGDGSDSQAKIDAAQAAYDAVRAIVEAMADSEGKQALLAELDEILQLIDAAQGSRNLALAETAVEEAQAAADALAADGSDTQAEIDAVQQAHDDAKDLATALPESAEKTALLAQLADIQEQIDAAQDAFFNARIAEAEAAVAEAEAAADGLGIDGTDTQEEIAAVRVAYMTAKTLVEDLHLTPEKADLSDRLAAVLAMMAEAALETAEAAAAVLDGSPDNTREDVDEVWSAYLLADELVEELPAGHPEKQTWRHRLAEVKIDAAGFAVEVAEQTAAALDGSEPDQDDIDAAQDFHDWASDLVGSLPAGDSKDDLLARLAVVQDLIDAAQDELNEAKLQQAQDAVADAQGLAEALAGDGSDDQADIDAAYAAYAEAKELVDALPASADKTALLADLAVVKELIDTAQDALDAENLDTATAAVEAAEAAAEALAELSPPLVADVQDAQDQHDAAAALVNNLREGIDQQPLLDRLAAVQLLIDEAQESISYLRIETVADAGIYVIAARHGDDYYALSSAAVGDFLQAVEIIVWGAENQYAAMEAVPAELKWQLAAVNGAYHLKPLEHGDERLRREAGGGLELTADAAEEAADSWHYRFEEGSSRFYTREEIGDSGNYNLFYLHLSDLIRFENSQTVSGLIVFAVTD